MEQDWRGKKIQDLERKLKKLTTVKPKGILVDPHMIWETLEDLNLENSWLYLTKDLITNLKLKDQYERLDPKTYLMRWEAVILNDMVIEPKCIMVITGDRKVSKKWGKTVYKVLVLNRPGINYSGPPERRSTDYILDLNMPTEEISEQRESEVQALSQ